MRPGRRHPAPSVSISALHDRVNHPLDRRNLPGRGGVECSGTPETDSPAGRLPTDFPTIRTPIAPEPAVQRSRSRNLFRGPPNGRRRPPPCPSARGNKIVLDLFSRELAIVFHEKPQFAETDGKPLGEGESGADRSRRHCSLRKRKGRHGQCNDQRQRMRVRRAQPRPLGRDQPERPLPSRSPGTSSTMAGIRSRSCRPSRRRCRSRAAHHPDAQRFPRHLLRPVDQSLSRVRARLRLLLCAADAQLYRALSPGLDFESKLFAKPDAARLSTRNLPKEGYQPRTIAIGTNTDPYQPIEKQWRIVREILEVLDAAAPRRHRARSRPW